MSVDTGAAAPSEVELRVTVVNRRGLHARAAAKLVECARKFEAAITVTRDGNTVSALSIMGLMTLGASPGVTLDMRAKGRDASAALDAVAALFAAKFNED
jgi:phosphocarrier protein HPr